MKYLQLFPYLALMLVLLACGNNTKEERQQNRIDRLTMENDSLLKESDNADKTLSADTTEDIQNEKKPKLTSKREGRHPISLQWIGWDQPGTAVVKPMDNVWYSIEGVQKNKFGDYLRIEGRIKRISEKELLFNGTITTRVSGNNKGKPCIKEGSQYFFAKGNRTYFRLQHMANCEGGMLVDYVDIYAGSSSL